MTTPTDLLAGLGGALGGPLVSIFIKAGAPILADLVKGQSPVAGKIVETIAEQLGVPATPEAIVAAHMGGPETTEAVIRKVEADSPEYWAYLANADKSRAGIFAQEAAEPWFAWAWRPFWMWMLAGLWVLTALCIMLRLPTIDLATLLGLTGIFAGLYMGGHAAQDIFSKVWGKSGE